MLQILTGFPEPKKLKVFLFEHSKIPEVCQSAVYGLLQELATGFISIPKLDAAGRNLNENLGDPPFEFENPLIRQFNPFIGNNAEREARRALFEGREPARQNPREPTP